MADQETKADDLEDQGDTSGHKVTAEKPEDDDDTEGHGRAKATPDEDLESRMAVQRGASATSDEDDAAGHKF
jgi:hypothetical protein